MINQKRLKQVLYYHPESGDFVWLENRPPLIRAGQQAGRLSDRGYMHISVDDRRYLAHRLAWLYMMGRWPKRELDHIDRVKFNNVWTNLREATRSQNRCNVRAYKGNLANRGIAIQRNGKYRVTVQVRGERRSFGAYFTLAEARDVRRQAVQALHGAFAP